MVGTAKQTAARRVNLAKARAARHKAGYGLSPSTLRRQRGGRPFKRGSNQERAVGVKWGAKMAKKGPYKTAMNDKFVKPGTGKKAKNFSKATKAAKAKPSKANNFGDPGGPVFSKADLASMSGGSKKRYYKAKDGSVGSTPPKRRRTKKKGK